MRRCAQVDAEHGARRGALIVREGERAAELSHIDASRRLSRSTVGPVLFCTRQAEGKSKQSQCGWLGREGWHREGQPSRAGLRAKCGLACRQCRARALETGGVNVWKSAAMVFVLESRSLIRLYTPLSGENR